MQQNDTYFKFRQSATLIKFLDCLHAISYLSCWMNDLDFSYQFMFSIMVIISWFYQNNRVKPENFQLRYSNKLGWQISTNGEFYEPIKIKTNTYVSSYLTILNFTNRDRTFTHTVFKDAISKNEYRQFVVQLKISC